MKKKYFLVALIFVMSIYIGYSQFTSYTYQKKVQKIEMSLFPEIKKMNFPYKSVKCDPAFVTYREQELYIYCHPLKNTEDKDLIEHLRNEVTKLAQNWSEKQNEKPSYIRVRFTNEISTFSSK